MHRWWSIVMWVALALSPAVVQAASTSEHYQLDGVEWSGSVFGTGQSSQFDVTPSALAAPSSAAEPTTADPVVPAPTGTGTPPTGPRSPQPPPLSSSSLSSSSSSLVDEVRASIAPVAALPAVRTTAASANVATAIATAIAVAAPLVANAPLLNPLGQLVAWLLSLGGRHRRRAQWGTVRDSESGQPIPLVLIRLLRADDGKLVSSVLTDHQGRFSLTPVPGRYLVTATKAGYMFPSKVQAAGYHGQPLGVTRGDELALDLALDPDLGRVGRRLWQLDWFEGVSRALQPLLVTVGSAFTVVYAIVEPTPLHLGTLVAYGILFASLVWRRFRHTEMVSRVVDHGTRRGVPLAIVRLSNLASDQLVLTRVSDPHGALSLAVAPGSYRARVTHPAFAQYESEPWEETGQSLTVRRTFSLEPREDRSQVQLAAARPDRRAVKGTRRRTIEGGIIIERGPDFAVA